MGNQKLKVISTRITEPLARVIEEYMRMAAHVTPADFVRDAIREKLKRDVPGLYTSMFAMEATQIPAEALSRQPESEG